MSSRMVGRLRPRIVSAMGYWSVCGGLCLCSVHRPSWRHANIYDLWECRWERERLLTSAAGRIGQNRGVLRGVGLTGHGCSLGLVGRVATPCGTQGGAGGVPSVHLRLDLGHGRSHGVPGMQWIWHVHRCPAMAPGLWSFGKTELDLRRRPASALLRARCAPAMGTAGAGATGTLQQLQARLLCSASDVSTGAILAQRCDRTYACRSGECV